ncbi:storkhead-box protein 2-like isoform X1 [Vespula squamosa]|uniref:Storkhead-box protein 2-like isoform X1 n=1 Tax=Vespula squamosa TaxID=30214 RepID=A0ABD2B835_VESSQ
MDEWPAAGEDVTRSVLGGPEQIYSVQEGLYAPCGARSTSLAIQLTRGPPPQVLNAGQRESPKEHPADEMWMYDKGYNLFQRITCAPQYTSLFIATVNTY